MATPIRLPLSPRQAEALSTLLNWYSEEIWDMAPLTSDQGQALREVAEKLSTLREGR